MIGTDFWLYSGEPTDEEIQARKQWDKDNYDHHAIRPECPTCSSKNTMWIRSGWCVCFNCDSSFTLPEHAEDNEDGQFWSQFESQV